MIDLHPYAKHGHALSSIVLLTNINSALHFLQMALMLLTHENPGLCLTLLVSFESDGRLLNLQLNGSHIKVPTGTASFFQIQQMYLTCPATKEAAANDTLTGSSLTRNTQVLNSSVTQSNAAEQCYMICCHAGFFENCNLEANARQCIIKS